MAIEIDPERDALVIVDVQNDFCPEGALGVPEGDRVVPVLNRYAERFAALGAPVFASRDWHPAETTDGMPFAAALGERGVSRLFIGGLATDYCVKSTVVDGVQAGFEMVVLEDAIAAVDLTPGDGERALETIRATGAQIVRLDDVR